MTEARIKGAEPGSIAEELGVEAGDVLLSVNKHPIRDIFDYRFFEAEEELSLLFRTKDGEEVEIEIEKDTEEGLGLIFESGLIDAPKRCANKCVFCFIDQLPKGMRESLYFKDDDTRLSFLHGNYVTMTNLKDDDLKRIADMKISVLNVSVHTTNPELRVRMLGNKNAGNIMERLRFLTEHGICLNTQVVLCPEMNDGEELVRTIQDLMSLMPRVNSLSIVPVGVTAHRDGLFPLRTFTEKEAESVVRTAEKYQKECLKKYGRRFLYLSDEFYLLAGLPIPDAEEYEDFPQIENGVGLMASLKEEWDAAKEEAPEVIEKRSISIATGTLAAPFIRELMGEAMKKYPNLSVRVYDVLNRHFGKSITVAGLVCGKDIEKELSGKELGEKLYIPSVMLRHETEDFLDDVTVGDLSRSLHVPIEAVPNDGYVLFEKITRG